MRNILIAAMLVAVFVLALKTRNTDNLTPAKGPQAPDFELSDLQGATTRLSDLHGKLVMLFFFSTSCRACMQSFPIIAELHNKHAAKGLVVLGISSGEGPSRLANVLGPMNIPFKILLDRSDEAHESYKVRGIPHLVLVGPDGRIASPHEYPWPADALEQKIEDALKGV